MNHEIQRKNQRIKEDSNPRRFERKELNWKKNWIELNWIEGGEVSVKRAWRFPNRGSFFSLPSFFLQWRVHSMNLVTSSEHQCVKKSFTFVQRENRWRFRALWERKTQNSKGNQRDLFVPKPLRAEQRGVNCEVEVEEKALRERMAALWWRSGGALGWRRRRYLVDPSDCWHVADSGWSTEGKILTQWNTTTLAGRLSFSLFLWIFNLLFAFWLDLNWRKSKGVPQNFSFLPSFPSLSLSELQSHYLKAATTPVALIFFIFTKDRVSLSEESWPGNFQLAKSFFVNDPAIWSPWASERLRLTSNLLFTDCIHGGKLGSLSLKSDSWRPKWCSPWECVVPMSFSFDCRTTPPPPQQPSLW